MNQFKSLESLKELSLYRKLLTIAAVTYFLWWVAVEVILPGSFNPLASRIFVVAITLAILTTSYFNHTVRTNIRVLFYICAWLITAHYFYLFYGNAGGTDWMIGCFVTVVAVNFCFVSYSALFSYSIFVIVLSLILVFYVPSLGHTVFLPGLLTIAVQANIGLRSRLGVLKTLADSNERFLLLFNSTFEGILLHNNGIITNVNQSLAKMVGTSTSELIGMNILEIIHPNERARVAEKVKLAEVPVYETIGLRKDGSPVDIEVRARNFEIGNQTARLVAVLDLTDRKTAEKQKITALTMAENVRVRDEFISIASHELKTPISSLKLQTQLIERDIKRMGTNHESFAKMGEVIALFNRQIDRLIELIETMLDVSRISGGRLTLNIENVELSGLVKDVVSRLQLQDPKSGMPVSTIRLETPDQLMIAVDSSRIKQVIENLITNAIKYGDGKAIEVKVFAQSNRALITIKDHGIGIAADYKDRIFNRFERAISAKNISGFGLGLYIAKEIIEAHSGSIIVDSVLGAGSTFTVSLPIKIS